MERRQLVDELRAMKVVMYELDKATKKNGAFNSAHEAYAVLLEEVDELWDDIKVNKGYSQEAMLEAMQVSAMAMRYLIDFGKDTDFDDSGRPKYGHEIGAL
jgi:hypothetical protein